MTGGKAILTASAAIAALSGLFAAASATETASPPNDGEALFQERCAACHDARGFGTRILSRRVPDGEAQLEDRTMLPAPYVRMVVRNGLGSMPAIRSAELDDESLTSIVAYLEKGE